MDRAKVCASTSPSTTKGDTVAPVHESPGTSSKKSGIHSSTHHRKGHHRKRRVSEKGGPEQAHDKGKSRSRGTLRRDSGRRASDKRKKSSLAPCEPRTGLSKAADAPVKEADRSQASNSKNVQAASNEHDAVAPDDPQGTRNALPNVDAVKDLQQPVQGGVIVPPSRAHVSLPAEFVRRELTDSRTEAFTPGLSAQSSKLAVSVVIALATLLVSALTASVMTWLLPSGTTVRHLFTRQIQSACSSDDCRTAVGILELSVDSNANICDDVYAFVCGHWSSTGSAAINQSYHQKLYDGYVPVAHNALTAQQSLNDSVRPDVRQLIRLYESCLAFFSNESTSLQELWKAADVDAAEWINVTSFPELVRLIVSSSFRNQMPSMLRIHWNGAGGGENAIVRTGRSLKADAPVPDIVDKVLDRVPKGLMVSSSKAKISAEILRVEDKISKLTDAWKGYDSATPVAVTALDMPALGVTWAPLLNRTGHVTTVMCSSVSGVKSIIDTLASTQLRVAALYALLVPFSALIGLDIRATEHRGHHEVATKRKICLGSVEFLLTKTFRHALRTVVDVKTALIDVSLMCKRILIVSGQALTIAKDVKLNATLLKEACAKGVYIAGAETGIDVAVLETNEVWHGGDFAVNLLLYTRATGRAVNVKEMLVENLRRRRFVPLAFMFPDFYYSRAIEPSINYGTLGVFVAEMVEEHAVPKHPAPVYKECLAKYAKEELDLIVELRQVDSVWRTSWAMNAAERASSSDGQELDLAASKIRAKLFYLRFAQTYCGDQDTSRLVSLRYATKTSPRYAETFGCARPKPVSC